MTQYEYLLGLLGEGEADKANPPDVVRCLRLETIARYNKEEDEFEANAFTSAFKVLDPIPQFKATARLALFLQGSTAVAG